MICRTNLQNRVDRVKQKVGTSRSHQEFAQRSMVGGSASFDLHCCPEIAHPNLYRINRDWPWESRTLPTQSWLRGLRLRTVLMTFLRLLGQRGHCWNT